MCMSEKTINFSIGRAINYAFPNPEENLKVSVFIDTIKNHYNRVFSCPKESVSEPKDFVAELKEIENRNAIRAISQVGEGNIRIQLAQILTEDDVKKLRDRVLSHIY